MKRLFHWLNRQRNSTRLTFLLQMFCRVASSLLSFLWTRLLLQSMGAGLNGLFLNFQRWATLGNLGDLGMGGVINIRASRLLGQNKPEELSLFLAAARSAFLVMAIVAGIVFWFVSPQLFHLAHFDADPQTGWLPILALVGSAAVAMVVLNSYINNLNYGCGNITWPVVPIFLIMQLAILGHWLLARQGMVLWMQYIPYVGGAVLMQLMGWIYLRASYPHLGKLFPMRLDRKQLGNLFGNSFWIYLGSVATGIWVTTDLLLITAWFGAAMVPAYLYNNKLCELVSFVTNSASAASTPKITQWLASPESVTRERGIDELLRLSRFQTLLCCCGTLVYLDINDRFMHFWLGGDFQVPLLWQAAFAAYLAVYGTGYGATEMASRCCDRGIRITGIASLLSALMNLGLSILAAVLSPKIGMTNAIFGIAFATVIAQSALLVYLSRFTGRQLQIPWWTLFGWKWLIALATVIGGVGLRIAFPPNGAMNIILLAVISITAFLLIAFLLGIGLADLQREKGIFRSMFGNRK